MKIPKTKITHALLFAMVLAYGLPTVAAPQKAEADTPENPVLSVVAADLNGDKHVDSALLLRSGDQADLYVYLSNAAGDMELKAANKNVAWSGAMAGTLPHLRVEKDGGLLVYSQNDAVGRDRWHQKLSVDYRENDFVVTGYTYDAQDTLDPKSNFVCDVNLLTGAGTKDKKEFKVEGQKTKLSDWSDAKIPKQCKN